ncbi:BTAD domain-containing putative transcriptional regulator [Streptomyces sp. NPDC001657]|uniref:AfsR/SARP family transcriptional regulator n=1 Tax=Streptomyces sp. NPDC001657 TaxID=3154522 RepID=UPI003319373B
MRKPDAPSSRGHLADDTGGHHATGPGASDRSKADVGLRLLRVALRLLHEADGGDEVTVRALRRLASSLAGVCCEGCGRNPASPTWCRRATDAHLIRSWTRELLALLDADEEPPGLAPGAVRSGHPVSVEDAGAPLTVRHPDGERRHSSRRAIPPGSTSPLPAAVPNGPIGRWHPLPASTHTDERNPRVTIRCFGGFRMTMGDLVIDWTRVRPRARAAMRLLTMRAGRPVHREALIEALWPDMPPKSATANLQVAVSSLRSLLEPDRDLGKPRLVVRVGDAYLLNLPVGAYLDTLAFQTALTRSRQAKATGDSASAVQGLRDALAQYQGELLPEDGPAEWLQQDREIYRHQAADAAAELAAAELQAGNSQEAVAAAQKCLAIDRFHDTGWHLLLRAYHRIGAPAAAEQTRRRYLATLASLGLDADERAACVAQHTRPSRRPGRGEVADLPVAAGRLSFPADWQ